MIMACGGVVVRDTHSYILPAQGLRGMMNIHTLFTLFSHWTVDELVTDQPCSEQHGYKRDNPPPPIHPP